MHFRLAILLTANSVSILSTWLLGPIYATYVETVSGTAFSAGASWATMAIVSALVMFATGPYIDKQEDQLPALAIGYALLGAGSIGFLVATDVTHVYLVQAVNGIGMGLVMPSWKALYADEEEQGKEVREWGWADGTSQLISGFGALAGGVIVTTLSFSTLFTIMAVLQFIAAILTRYYYHL